MGLDVGESPGLNYGEEVIADSARVVCHGAKNPDGRELCNVSRDFDDDVAGRLKDALEVFDLVFEIVNPLLVRATDASAREVVRSHLGKDFSAISFLAFFYARLFGRRILCVFRHLYVCVVYVSGFTAIMYSSHHASKASRPMLGCQVGTGPCWGVR